MTVASNAIAVYASLIVRLSSGLGATFILARKLAVEDFGVLVICTGAGALFWTVCDYGISLRGQRLFTGRSLSPDRLSFFFRNALRFRSIIALVTAPVFLALGMLHHDLAPSDLPLLLMALAFGWSSAVSPGWILSLQQRNWSLLPFDIAAAIASLLIAQFFVGGRADLWATLAGQVVINLALLRWYTAASQTQQSHQLRMTAWLRYFLPALGLRIAYTLISIGLVVTYSTSNPAATVAVYAAADRMLRFAITGMSPLFTLSAPYLFSPTHAKTRCKPRFRLLFISAHGAIGLIAAVIMALAAPVAIHSLYGPKYDASIPVMLVLSAALPFWMVENAVVTQMLVQEGRERIALAIVSIAAFTIASAALLGAVRSPFGMAIATVAVEAFVAVGGVIALWPRKRGVTT